MHLNRNEKIVYVWNLMRIKEKWWYCDDDELYLRNDSMVFCVFLIFKWKFGGGGAGVGGSSDREMSSLK